MIVFSFIACKNEPVDNTVEVGTEEELVAAIEDGTKPIRLKENIAAKNIIEIKNGQSITIDLNGKNISLDNYFKINANDEDMLGGKVEITGKGVISSTTNFVFRIHGNYNKDLVKKCTLSIGKDVKLDGPYAVSVYPGDNKNKYACYDVTVDIYGKAIGNQPVYVSGNIKNIDERAPKINIKENAEITGVKDVNNPAMYIAGYSKTVIEKNAKIISEDNNAIEFAAGELEINGAVITGGNNAGSNAGSGGSISSTSSSAIFIKQHSTNLNLKITINSGKFVGYIPLVQAKGQSGTSAKPELVDLEIKGGEFICTNDVTPKFSVKSNDKEGFITGGTFSVEPDASYIKTGYESKKQGDVWVVSSKTV